MTVSEMATYQYSGNNPVMFSDPLGDIKVKKAPTYPIESTGFGLSLLRYMENRRPGNQFGIGDGGGGGMGGGGGGSGGGSMAGVVSAALQGQEWALSELGLTMTNIFDASSLLPGQRLGGFAEVDGSAGYWVDYDYWAGEGDVAVQGLQSTFVAFEAQQEDQVFLRNFLLNNFGDEIRELNNLANNTDQRLAWWIDLQGKYTGDPGIPGDTRRIKARSTTYISIHSYPMALALTGDSRLLHVVVARELVHARDILNGNMDFWLDWYGESRTHDIMEHHAYTRSAAVEKQLGVSYGSAMMLNSLFVPYDYLNIR